MPDCAACGYPTEGWALCTWCWETLIAGNAAQALGVHANLGDVDPEMAVLAAEFITRAVVEQQARKPS
jgi:hypothetical protein